MKVGHRLIQGGKPDSISDQLLLKKSEWKLAKICSQDGNCNKYAARIKICALSHHGGLPRPEVDILPLSQWGS